MTLDVLKRIWVCYLKIRAVSKSNGAVTKDSLLYYLEERDYSIVSLPFYRFFYIIEKKEEYQVTFHELLPGLITFCLFTRSEILGFVFHMIDEDRDNHVSKADIFKQLLTSTPARVVDGVQVGGQRVNPPNVTRAIELVYNTRGDNMNVTQFAELVDRVPFIIFPAVRLQQTMREKFGGKSLWRKVAS